MQTSTDTDATVDKNRVFELAAELFGILATPTRLRILNALCDKEKSVSELLAEIDTTQPDRKSTRLNSSHIQKSRMPSSA